MLRADRDRARRMLDDKQSAKSIALLISKDGGPQGISEEDILALAKPKPALDAFKLYLQDRRDAAIADLGSSKMGDIMKALAEQWSNEVDKSRWEQLADEDQERWQREMAVYQQRMEAEDAEDEQKRQASGGKRVVAPPGSANSLSIREQLWQRARLVGEPRNFTSEERKEWPPLAQEKFKAHKRMRDEGYANVQTLVWLASHVGMPEPPAKIPRSAYAMFSQQRVSEVGCSMGNA